MLNEEGQQESEEGNRNVDPTKGPAFDVASLIRDVQTGSVADPLEVVSKIMNVYLPHA